MFLFKNYKKTKLFSTMFFLIMLINPSLAFTDDKNICEKQIIEIERQINIPKGLLKAIGLTESGRYIEKSKKVIWPWTINYKKKSLFFESKSQMLKFLESKVKKGNYDLDVGCMQINLKWHGKYFKKISDSIDPKINISYATSFLFKLKSDFKTWTEAIKRYHSSKPSKNIKYHKKVLANWNVSKNTKVKRKSNSENSLKSHIRDNQPNLFKSYEKIIFFRKIFMEKNYN